jgi:hypothetical protein
MPFKIVNKGGLRPWKIVKVHSDGSEKVVGSSTSKAEAEASVRMRNKTHKDKTRGK